jgi:hypothetical protein
MRKMALISFLAMSLAGSATGCSGSNVTLGLVPSTSSSSSSGQMDGGDFDTGVSDDLPFIGPSPSPSPEDGGGAWKGW